MAAGHDVSRAFARAACTLATGATRWIFFHTGPLIDFINSTELGANVIMLPVSVAGTKPFPDNIKIGGFSARKVA